MKCDPACIAISQKGEIFVADCCFVRVYRPDRSRVRTWRINGHRYFHHTFGWRTLDHPRSIALSANEVFLADHCTLQVFREDGCFLRTIVTHLHPSNWITSCAISGNRVTIARDYTRPQVFDLNGSFVRHFDCPELPIWPSHHGLAIDNDLIFVADFHGHRILVVDLYGMLIRTWGSEGKGKGQFQSISTLAIAHGEVFVGDERRIQVFSPDGCFLRQHHLSDSAKHFAVSQTGQIFIVTEHYIQVFPS